MKIAQITLNDYANYGNFLQKYAIQRTLKKFSRQFHENLEELLYGENNKNLEPGGIA